MTMQLCTHLKNKKINATHLVGIFVEDVYAMATDALAPLVACGPFY